MKKIKKIFAFIFICVFCFNCNITLAKEVLVYAGEKLDFNLDKVGFDNNDFIINQDDSSGDIKLKFGDSIGESIEWNELDSNFKISDDVEIEGEIKITGGNPDIGKVLTSDEFGNASWQTPTGVTPSGNNGEIQFNKNGSLSSDIDLKWDEITNQLKINNKAVLTEEGNNDKFHDLEVGHGFNLYSGTGSISSDTLDYISGKSSVKITSDGLGNAVFARKTSINPNIDLKNKYLSLWIKIDNPSELLEVYFYISSDNFSSNFYTFKISDDLSIFKPNTWTRVSLPFGEATENGTVDKSKINSAQIRIKDKSNTSVNVHMDSIDISPEKNTGGILSITFDDNWISQYTEGKRIMDKYAFKGTAYIMPNKVNEINHMTLAQLKELYKTGWDISGHHETNLTSLTEEEIETIFKNTKNYLYKNGFHKGAEDFAYPNGAWNETVINLAKKYFRSARTIIHYDESIIPGDYYLLRSFTVNKDTTVDEIMVEIERAKNNNSWLILVFHKLVNNPIASTEYPIGKFDDLINRVKISNIRVKTISDVLNISKISNGFNGVDIDNIVDKTSNQEIEGIKTLKDGLIIGENGTNTSIRKNGSVAGDEFYVGSNGAMRLQRSVSGGEVFRSQIAGDIYGRFAITSNGALKWGDSLGPQDTILYRGGENKLRTDDDFVSSGSIGAGSSSTPGSILEAKGAGNTETSKTFRLLNSDNDTLMTVYDNGYVGISATNPTSDAKLDINGKIKISGGSPGTNKVLLSDSSGLASWETFNLDFMDSVFYDNSSLYIGNNGSNDDGNNRNTSVGHLAMQKNSSGEYNTSVGYLAMSENTTGNYNSAIGSYALYGNTTGIENTAIGMGVLRSNTTGNDNTALGFDTLNKNTTGNSNMAIGRAAMRNNIIGNNNTAVGFDALRYNEEGDNNTAIGYEAGQGVNSHNKSGGVFIGYQAGYGDESDNKLYIANGSNILNTWIYGDENYNIGLGTSNPKTRLEVDGIIKTTPVSSATCTIDTEGGIYYDSDDKKFYGCNGLIWVSLSGII